MDFAYLLKEDRSLLELIECDYTFLNEDLAKHYGISGVTGPEMRKVMLPPGSPRGGVLTQGTTLAVTSNPTRTSPVKRGVFILNAILGTPPAPPPPNIPALEDAASPEKIKHMTLRETLALHAQNDMCRSCHSRMDPLGLALENFNALGMWRDAELGRPVEPAGTLITGEPFADIRALKHVLATKHRRDYYYCVSEKLLTYALGRGLIITMPIRWTSSWRSLKPPTGAPRRSCKPSFNPRPSSNAALKFPPAPPIKILLPCPLRKAERNEPPPHEYSERFRPRKTFCQHEPPQFFARSGSLHRVARVRLDDADAAVRG